MHDETLTAEDVARIAAEEEAVEVAAQKNPDHYSCAFDKRSNGVGFIVKAPTVKEALVLYNQCDRIVGSAPGYKGGVEITEQIPARQKGMGGNARLHYIIESKKRHTAQR